MRTTLKLFFKLLVIVLFFTSCSGTRYLKDGEQLLFKQNIKNTKNFDRYTLEELYASRPNRRFPPYASIYQAGLKRYDSAKFINKKEETVSKYEDKIAKTEKERKKQRYRTRIQNISSRMDEKLRDGNTLMQWGESVSVYDSMSVERSRQNLNSYIFNEGYFRGLVKTSKKVNSSGKKVSVTFSIEESNTYRIDTIIYRAADTVVLAILTENSGESYIQKQDRYTQSNLIKERERLEFLLKDHGFFDFSRQYVSFDLDTGRYSGQSKVAVRMNINQPARGTHKQYVIDSMNFRISADYEVLSKRVKSKEESFEEVEYYFFEDIFSSRMLDRRIFVRKDSLYSRSNTLKTQRQLANMNNFKFININYDSSGGRFIANIFTRPLDRYQISQELGSNTTQGAQPGIFYNLSFTKRNIFRSFENFEINGRFGIDGVATPSGSIYQNREIGGDIKFYFPKFVIPGGGRIAEKFEILNPQTRLQAGYKYTNRSDYTRENLNFANTLSWEGVKNDYFSFSITELSLIRTDRISPDFQAILDQNSRLQSAFNNSFVSNINFTYYRSDVSDRLLGAGISRYFRTQVESGGTILNFAGTNYLEGENLEYFKYLRVDFDYRKTTPTSRSSSVAYRINVGVAAPYGDNRTLPYEKFFFAGGSSGIRAWAPRRLGPGSFTPLDNDSGKISYAFEQQGEVLIQASIEYRKDLLGFTEYALFLDAGNIWNFYDDPNRIGGKFSADFYKQIAVGSGIGLRFDFSFLILRLDVGVKTVDPARPAGKRFILNKGFFDAPFDTYKGLFRNDILVYNIGVGYPF